MNDWGSAGLCVVRKYFRILSAEFDQHHSKGSSVWVPFQDEKLKRYVASGSAGILHQSWGSKCSALLDIRFRGIGNGPVWKRRAERSPALTGTTLPQQCLHGVAEEGEALSHSSLSS